MSNLTLGKLLFTGGIDESDFRKIEPNIQRSNYDMLRIVIIVTFALFCILTVVSLPNGTIHQYLPLYVFYTIFLAITYIVVTVLHDKHPAIVLICWYLCGLITSAYAILMGTYMDPTMLGTVFCVFLFAYPMLFVDRPIRIILLLVVSTAGFCVCTHLTKEPHIAATDTVNALSFFFLSSIVNTGMMRIRIREQEQRCFIESQRDTDYLTGLMRKSAFAGQVESRLNYSASGGYFIIIDLDNFKRVNDKYGHEVGDTIIRQAARCINTCFDSYSLKGRFGGDEFVVFTNNADECEDVEVCLNKLMEMMPKETELPDKNDLIQCSAGITTVSPAEKDYSTIFRQADAALYTAKREGKNRFCYYKIGMQLDDAHRIGVITPIK